MVRLAILADTHMPRGPRRLPERCLELCASSDLILHAGDFTETAVLEELQAIRPVAVHGNVDSPELRAALPESLVFEAGGATVAMVHDSGPRRGRLERRRPRRGRHLRPLAPAAARRPARASRSSTLSPTERRRARPTRWAWRA